MRGKTVKRLAILIGVFILVAGSAFAIWKIQVGKMAQGVVEQADRAAEKKELAEAVELYQQHLLVFPDDKVVQLKYADILLKVQPTPKNQGVVMGIYNEILKAEPGRDDVRRKVAELALSLPGNPFEAARRHLAILLKSAPKDGQLEFLMGRCYEGEKESEKAARSFRDAIEHGAPERIDASLRLATLIRENGTLGEPQEADNVMDEMVAADPGNYQVYLERGHYRRRFDLEGAGADFLKSLELAPDRAEIFVELSQLAERDKAMDEARRILDEHRPFTFLLPRALDVARRILEDGQEALPNSPILYLARADLERKAGRVDRYVEILEEGTRRAPQNVPLRLQVAWVLAAQGDTSKLLLHIEELKGLGVSRVVIDYLLAYYNVNIKDFERAKYILGSIQADIAQNPELKVRVNVLLAKCYGQLHDPDKEWEANQRAYNTNPKDPAAQEAWIAGFIGRLVKRGRIDEAINEYRRQLDQTPQLPKMQLVRLLIGRNRQRPLAQRDWREVEALLDEMVKASPNAVELVALRATLYAEQDEPAKALEALEAARLRFPEAVEPWSAEAEILVRQKKFDEALGRLDLAQKKLDGDRVELRLARAAIWAGRGAPKEEVVKILKRLAEDVDRFPKPKRKGLLSYLAAELAARQELQAAEGLWARLAEDDREDVQPHVQLFELALKSAEKAERDEEDGKKSKADIAALEDVIAKAKADIEAQIKAMEAIDPILGRFYEARYLTWRAAPSKGEMQGKRLRAGGAEPRSREQAEKKKLRAEARDILAELKKRREEWEQIPLAEAILDEQSLAQEDLDEAERRERQESLLNHCLAAIQLGSRNPELVRLGVELLFATGRSNEAIQLFNRMAEFTQLGGDLGQRVAQVAIAQNNEQAAEVTRKAEESARAAVAANPGSFKEQRWLAQILLAVKRNAEAEAVLRSAVDQDKGDPDRWVNLVSFLVLTKQLPQAEQALRDAQKSLTDAPLALADCCERIGKAGEGPDAVAVAKKWYDEARKWYDKALDARKDTKERSATLRLLVQFLGRTDPPAAEEKLKAILAQPDGALDDVTLGWCRRILAVYYIKSNPRRADKALALFQAAGHPGAGTTPDDSRVRAQVLAAQGTPEHYREAIAILESLVDEKLAALEDRHMLAQIEELAGDWPKAREQYRSLIEFVTNGTGDPDRSKRQVLYLGDFAERLLRSHQPAEDKDKDIAEAQELIERLKRLQPDPIEGLMLEVALATARNDFEGAAARIRSLVERPDLNLNALQILARMAEKIGQSDEFKLAEEIYRKIALAPKAPFNPNKVMLVQFLARHGRFAAVVDLCESLRKNPADRGSVDQLCIELFASPTTPVRPEQVEQIKRLIGWCKEEPRDGPQALSYQMALGALYDRLGEDRVAEGYYRAIADRDDRQGIASNNLAWLMALNSNRWNDALDLVNRAIRIGGPIPDFLDTRGVVYLKMGQNDRAITDFTDAIKAAAIKGQPTATKYFHLAQAYLAKRDKENARKNLEAAMSKGPLPNGLHRYELPRYQQVRDELGMP